MLSSNAMGTRPVLPLLLSMSVPPMISMLIQSMYNVVDSIFVARLSQNALTAVSLAFPLQNLVLAVAVGLGVGLNACIARSLGAGDPEKANDAAAHGLVFTTIHALLFVLVGVFGTRPFLQMFTTDPEVLEMGCQYSYIVICLSFGSLYHIFIEKIFQATGNMVAPMILQGVGAIINIVLDPILIFGLNMGVQGAAVATVFSQACSAAWTVYFLCSKQSSIRIRPQYLRPSAKVMGSIAALGVAPFIMQSTESLVTITLNSGLQRYGGDLYVGSMTVLQSVMQMLTMPMQGITQGVQPIMSYNYGARNYHRVRRTFWLLLRTTLSITTVCCLVVVCLPSVFARIFTPDAQLIELVKQVMPIFFAGIWAFGCQMACQSLFMGLGQAKISLFLALLRKVILLVPLAVVLPLITHSVLSIYVAEPIADILSSCTALVMFLLNRKRLLPEG